MKYLQTMISKKTPFYIIILSFVALSVTSCKITAPLPEMANMEIPVGPTPSVSHINIPVNISIDPILKFANESSSPIIRNPEWPNFASFGACDGPQAKYDVFRENLNGYVVGNKFVVGTKAWYGIEGNYCTGCVWGNCVHPRIPFSCGSGNETKRRVEIEFSTNLSMNENYQLVTSTSLSKLNPIDPCELTFLKIDMTGEIMKAMQPALFDVCKYIDQQCLQVDFKSYANEAWKQLNSQMEIPGYGYLTFNASNFKLGPMYGYGNILQVNLGIDATPVMSLDKNESAVVPPLPLLNVQNEMTSGFVIQMPIKSSYETLSTKVNEMTAGSTFASDDNKKSITVKHLGLSGLGNQKIQVEVLCDMKVGFKKYKNCKFFLALTPNVDPSTNKMSVSSIEVDSKSKHVLMNAGVDVFQTKLAQTIQSACNVDLTPTLQSAKTEIEKQLNGELMPGVNLKGLLNNLQITGFYPTQKELQITVALNGNLQIDVVNYSTN
jgi:hypothetical protein